MKEGNIMKNIDLILKLSGVFYGKHCTIARHWPLATINTILDLLLRSNQKRRRKRNLELFMHLVRENNIIIRCGYRDGALRLNPTSLKP